MLKKTLTLSAILLTAISAIVALFLIDRNYYTEISDIPKIRHSNISPISPNKKPPSASPPAATSYLLPATLLLPVPFTPQAPTANWDELHNEACEEASAIMVAEYFEGNRNIQLDPEHVEGQISKLTNWQQQTFGYYLSINSQETAELIKEVYGLNAEVVEHFSADVIKKALADGKLVLLPANGRMLGNPYYKRPGPKYHMLVIKGYDSKGNFLTNDPGTKRGLNYPYTFEVLYAANGDWNHLNQEVDLSKKMMIAVWK